MTIDKATILKNINDSINRITSQQTQQEEYIEKSLIEIIEKYDFFVGSMEAKNKLMEILPNGANVVYSPYIEHPTMIYAIKKFDIMDLFSETYKAELDIK